MSFPKWPKCAVNRHYRQPPMQNHTRSRVCSSQQTINTHSTLKSRKALARHEYCSIAEGLSHKMISALLRIWLHTVRSQITRSFLPARLPRLNPKLCSIVSIPAVPWQWPKTMSTQQIRELTIRTTAKTVFHSLRISPRLSRAFTRLRATKSWWALLSTDLTLLRIAPRLAIWALNHHIVIKLPLGSPVRRMFSVNTIISLNGKKQCSWSTSGRLMMRMAQLM